jgi:hypothetical protein
MGCAERLSRTAAREDDSEEHDAWRPHGVHTTARSQGAAGFTRDRTTGSPRAARIPSPSAMRGGQGRDVRAVLGRECPVPSGDRTVLRGDPEIPGRDRAILVADRVVLGGAGELRCCHFGELKGHR